MSTHAFIIKIHKVLREIVNSVATSVIKIICNFFFDKLIKTVSLAS